MSKKGELNYIMKAAAYLVLSLPLTLQSVFCYACCKASRRVLVCITINLFLLTQSAGDRKRQRGISN